VRLGLALGSGAAHGAAHGGVLRALEEAGIGVDVVVGASAGAIVGGVFAAGLGAEQICDLLPHAHLSDFATATPVSPRLGVLDTVVLGRNVEAVVGDRRIEDLPVPFGAVVTEVGSSRPRLVTTGSLADAIRASSAVPGLFAPVQLDGRLCVDGGVLSPSPDWAPRVLGADVVVSVVLGASARWRTWLEARTLAPAVAGSPDLVVVVDTTGMSKWSSRDVPELIDRGYRATMTALETARGDRLLREAS
jgi:NTE family protein